MSGAEGLAAGREDREGYGMGMAADDVGGSGRPCPTHYNVPGFDCMAFIAAAVDRDADREPPSEAFMRGNALKYLIRGPMKGRAADYRKAADYCLRLAASVEARDALAEGVGSR